MLDCVIVHFFKLSFVSQAFKTQNSIPNHMRSLFMVNILIDVNTLFNYLFSLYSPVNHGQTLPQKQVNAMMVFSGIGDVIVPINFFIIFFAAE